MKNGKLDSRASPVVINHNLVLLSFSGSSYLQIRRMDDGNGTTPCDGRVGDYWRRAIIETEAIRAQHQVVYCGLPSPHCTRPGFGSYTIRTLWATVGVRWRIDCILICFTSDQSCRRATLICQRRNWINIFGESDAARKTDGMVLRMAAWKYRAGR